MIGKIGKMKGLAQIPLIIGLLIMAIAIPAATTLVQRSQDKRSSAASTNWVKCVISGSTSTGTCIPYVKGDTMCLGAGYGYDEGVTKIFRCKAAGCGLHTPFALVNSYWETVKTCQMGCDENLDTRTATCRPLGAKGATCKNDDYCASGVCHKYEDGSVKCIDANSMPDGSICKDSEECKSSKGCVSNGYCGYIPVGKNCGSSSDCKGGFCEVTSTGGMVCSECFNPSDCGTGKKCVIESGKLYHTCLTTSTTSTCSSTNCGGCSQSTCSSISGCTLGNGGLCVKKSTATPTKSGATCVSKNGTCITSYSGMKTGLSCTISSTKKGTTNTAYSCASSSQVCCIPSTATPTTKPATCGGSIYGACDSGKTCKLIPGQSSMYSCYSTATPTPVKTQFYYYDPSSKACSSTTATTITACNTAKHSACYTSNSACVSSYSGCTNAGGKCGSATSCNGTLKSGLCPGDSTIKCCVPTTIKPTIAPTKKPTVAPTKKPTAAPTSAANVMKYLNFEIRNLTDKSATIYGFLNSSKYNISSYWIEYGTTSSLGKSTQVTASSGSNLKTFSINVNLSGLTANTNYSYKIMSKTADGKTNSSSLMTFKTITTATPTTSTSAAVTFTDLPTLNITSQSASVAFGVNSADSNIVSYLVRYGAAGSSSLDQQTSTFTTNLKTGSLGVSLFNLTPNTTYFYGLVVTTADGKSAGSDSKSFTTLSVTGATPTTVKSGCGICPVGTLMAGQNRQAGDVNCDGIVNISDRSTIVDEMKNGLSIFGDLNCDGVVNILDHGLWRDKFISIH